MAMCGQLLFEQQKEEYKRPVVKLIPLGVHGTVSVSTPVSEHGAGDVADDHLKKHLVSCVICCLSKRVEVGACHM